MIDVTGSSDALGPSPIAVEGPARDGPWFLRTARLSAEGSQLAGVQLVTSGEFVMMSDCVSRAGPASTVRLDPGLVTRNLADGSVERIWVPVTLPMLIWEHEGTASTALEWRTPVGDEGSMQDIDAHFAEVIRENGGRIWFAASGGVLSARLHDGVANFRFDHSGPARLVAIGVTDETDGRRTKDHIARRGIPGLAAQRAQHSAHLASLGTRLRTPEEPVNRAFCWAAALCEAAASSGALDSPAGDLLAQGLRAAGLQKMIRLADMPGSVATPAPAEGVLSRLREAAELVEEGGSVMFGPDPAPAAATLVDAVRGLFGVTVDEAAGSVSLLPALPREWTSMALDRLRAGSALLDVEVRRRPSATAVAVRVKSGGPVTVSVGLPDVAVAQVDLDDVVMPAQRARFEARHDHLLVFRHAD